MKTRRSYLTVIITLVIAAVLLPLAADASPPRKGRTHVVAHGGHHVSPVVYRRGPYRHVVGPVAPRPFWFFRVFHPRRW